MGELEKALRPERDVDARGEADHERGERGERGERSDHRDQAEEAEERSSAPREDQLWRRLGVKAPTDAGEAASLAVDHKGGGQPIDAGLAAEVGSHLGVDLTGTRVHGDPLSRAATRAMGARAFAHRGDIFLGPGESEGDRELMTHELTHVGQFLASSGAGAAGKPQRKLAVGAENSPAEQHADEIAGKALGGSLAPTQLIVDSGPLAAGQLEKTVFQGWLRDAVVLATEQVLGKLGATAGCPFIDRYFSKYAALPAAATEGLIRRWVPSAKSAQSAAELIPPVVARAREAVRSWQATGRVPPELAVLDPEVASAPAAAASASGGANAMSLDHLEAELGAGDALDAATASRMSSALGSDVSTARLHSGPVAQRKAAEAGALAFAVGENVVLGARAPARGSLAGDALLAHELAHVAQQKHAASDPAARRKPIGGEDAAAELDADRAAAAGLTPDQLSDQRIASLSALAGRAGDVMRTGLQMQRCAEWKEDVTLQARLGLSIDIEPAPKDGKPFIVGQGLKVSLKQAIPGDHKAVVYHWEAIDPRGNKYLYQNGESTTVQMIWPGTTTIRAAVGTPGGSVIETSKIEHKVEAIRADTRATELVDGAEAPQDFKTFRATQDVNLALLSPDNTPSKEQAVFIRGGANPAKQNDGDVAFSLGYKEGEVVPPGRTQRWYAVPLQAKDAPNNLGTAPKTMLNGKEAYDLGAGATAKMPTTHKGVYVVTCQLFDAGTKAAEAAFVQTILDGKEIEAVNDLKTQMKKVDGEMGEFTTTPKGDADVVPVTAFHVDAATGAETQLSLFIGKHKDGSLAMINATPGLKLTENRIKFTGANTSAVLDDFDSNNKYPTGIVRFHIPGGKLAGVDGADRSIQTTGDTTLGHIAGILGMAALVVSVAAIPFTGGASATATMLLLGGAGLGVAAGAFSLADHLSNADYTTTSVSLDCLQIAASMVDLGFAVKALRASPALLVANRAARYAMWGNLMIQGASAVLISVEAIDQIAKVMDDPTLSRGEKLGALTRLIAMLVVTGALLMLSYKSMGEAKARMLTHFGETGRALKDVDAAALGLIDDKLLGTLKTASKEELERLAAMVRQDPALVTRLPGRKNIFGALKGCKTTQANELEMRLFSQRLTEAGHKGNNVKRITDAFQAAGIDAATAHLLTDADLARLKNADDALAGARSKRDADPAKTVAFNTAKTEIDSITGVSASTKGDMRAAIAHINGTADPAFVTDAVAALRAKFPKLPADDLTALGKLDRDALIALESASESDVKKIAARVKSGAQDDVEDILRSYYYKAKKPARKEGTPYEAPKDVGARVETSLDNLTTTRNRGYPYGFKDLAHYEAFTAKVKASLDKRKIPSGDVRVHGSAIHSKTPGDIDVAVIVDETTFNEIAARFKSAAKGDANATKALTGDIAKGKISSSNFYPDGKPSVAAEAAGAAGSLDTQVSLIKAGSEFDVGPYLKK
jgi:Domain of unknown function (DUF4157)